MEKEETIKMLIQRFEKIQEQQKVFYSLTDSIIDDLIKLMEPGIEKSLFIDGKAVFLLDNFADKNATFRTVCVKRYELKIEEAHKVQKKLKTLSEKEVYKEKELD